MRVTRFFRPMVTSCVPLTFPRHTHCLFAQRRFSSNDNHNPVASPTFSTPAAASAAWEEIIENIQAAVSAGGLESWLRFSAQWRKHFPQPLPPTALRTKLEEERVAAANSDDAYAEVRRECLPRELMSLSVFVQALCTAVRSAECALHAETSSEKMSVLRDVLMELRTVAFFLVECPLYDAVTDAAMAPHANASDATEMVPLNHSSTSLTPLSCDAERVRHLGVRYTRDEMQSALFLADAAAAMVALGPSAKCALRSAFRLLLPVLGACEQLDNPHLASVATTLAQCADMDLHGDSDDGGLRLAITPYTVLSHLHAIARALEVRLREAMKHMSGVKRHKEHATRENEARLRLLSLKERKAREMATKQNANLKEGFDSFKSDPVGAWSWEVELLNSVAVVSDAMAALRYADDLFWYTVADFTCRILECTTNGCVPIETQERVLHDTRHVLFAFDYAHQRAQYDRVMALLVRVGVLQKPIDPPSATQDVMKEVKGMTAANFTTPPDE